MAAIGAVVGILGSVVSAMGTIAAGNAAEAQADFEAKQLEIRASEERAASQREALENRREKEHLQSRLQAGASASGLGAGAMDTTIVDLAQDIEGQGTYNEMMTRYGGEERARGYRAQADASRMSGDAAKKGAMFSAFGTILGGVADTFSSKYGGGGPQAHEPAAFGLEQRPYQYGMGYG